MKRRIRHTLAWAAVVLLVLCCAFIAVESGHECHGEGCSVCAQIHFCVDVLISLVVFVTAGCLAKIATGNVMRQVAALASAVRTAMTPVTLRVRQDS